MDEGTRREAVESLQRAAEFLAAGGAAESDDAAALAALLATALGLAVCDRAGAAASTEIGPIRARLAERRTVLRTLFVQAGRGKVTMSPVQVLSESLLVLEDLDRLLRDGDPDRRAEACTGLALAHAAVLGAYLRARVRLAGADDPAVRERARGLIDQALVRASDRVREALVWLNERL